MKHGARVLQVLGALVLGPVTAASGQSFNVDIGPQGSSVPSSAYGGAASQPGVWNLGSGLLVYAQDISGIMTGVTIGIGGVKNTYAMEEGTAQEELLMEDSARAEYSFAAVQISGLAPGDYHMFVYGWNGCVSPRGQSVLDFYNPQSGVPTRREINYSSMWPGRQVEGETYTVYDFQITDPDQTMMFTYNGQSAGQHLGGTAVNGLQIVQVPSPGAWAMLMMLAGPRVRGRRREVTAYV